MWSSSPPGEASRQRPMEIQIRDLDAERANSSSGHPSSWSSRSSKPTSAVAPTVVSSSEPAASAPLSMGWLLRLFRSDFFDAWMAVTYLYRYRASRGVHDYLCNELYHLSDADLEAFLPQVCNLLVHHAKDSPALERFVMDKCSTSLHFAVQVYWFLQAAVEDAARDSNKDAESRCRNLRTRCETVAVNGIQPHSDADEAAAAAAAAAAASALAVSPSRVLPAAPGVAHDGLGNSADSSDRDQAPAAARPPIGVRRVRGAATGQALQEQVPARDAQVESVEPTVMTVSNSTASLDDIAKAVVAMAAGDENDGKGSAEGRNDADGAGAVCNVDGNSGSENAVENDGNIVGPGEQSIASDHATVGDVDDILARSVIEDDDIGEARGTTDDDGKDMNKGDDADEVQKLGSSASDIDMDTAAKLRALEESIGMRNLEISANVPIVEGGVASKCNEPESSSRDGEKGRIGSASSHTQHHLARTSEADAPSQQSTFDPKVLLTMKQERFDYFNDCLTVVKSFVRLSLVLRDVPLEQRPKHLKDGLRSVNDILLRRMAGEAGTLIDGNRPAPDAHELARKGRVAALRSIHLPLSRATEGALRILRVIAEDAIILHSRQRVPYMLFVEVLPTDMMCCDQLLYCDNVLEEMRAQGEKLPEAMAKVPIPENETGSSVTRPRSLSSSLAASPTGRAALLRGGLPSPSGLDKTPEERQRANVQKAVYGVGKHVDAFVDLDVLAPGQAGNSTVSVSSRGIGTDPDLQKAREAALLAVYGEMWSLREERILATSPFKDLPGAKLMPFIVKAGDDLRQEQLAMQLISQFQGIFKQESVDVYLRPFTIMSVSSDAGFVEVVPDSVSVHSLKKRTPNFVSLLDYFERAYGKVGTRSFRQVQRRFIQSIAGYSLVSYFMQIKDRHNGNIMLSAEGYIVHIDFGFMLTNSPGAIKFENAPFKMTEEYLQVVCARKNVQDAAEAGKTEGYRYFQELFVLGVLAARKHYEKLTTLVEIMMEGTSMPCMAGGHSVVESLRHRFFLGVSEEQCIAQTLALVEESRLSWRSASYDKFQNMQNGYL